MAGHARADETDLQHDSRALFAAAALAEQREMRSRVDRLLDAHPDVLHPAAVRTPLATPEQSAHELGFLFTWSLAQHDLDNSPPVPGEPRPSAAGRNL